ncbi:MAG: isoprenylcysteine carboxylmethyltransferase family protein [Clostridia bacterium]|nr:isoprenylcysteine carboxylmethyltransferase family protein [Clostridia bacterium]
MSVKLFFQALIKYLVGVVLVGLLLFLPAGTLNYFNGWLFMAVLFVPIFIAGIVMMVKNPELLKNRLESKEKQKDQSVVVKLSGLMFMIGFILPGLGVRFGWYVLPEFVTVIGAAVFLVSYLLYAEVMRENAYLSRTVKVEQNQKVVDTGLYGVVRHPMYLATVIMFLSMPIVLGSVYSFVVFLVYPFLIAVRIKGEEKLLENELDGYKEYKHKVKYRLFPFIW